MLEALLLFAAGFFGLYVAHHPTAIFETIRAEHARACELVLAIRGGSQLLDNHPDMAESVALAAEVVDPLNHLQVELLARRLDGVNAQPA